METETIEVLEGDEQLIAQSIGIVRDTLQEDVETYVEPMQSKYHKIGSKRIKTDHSLSKTSSSYNVKSSFKSNNSNLFDATILTTNASILPMKKVNSTKNSDTDLDNIYSPSETKTSLELFFDSMAQTVKKLPPKAQADIKMNICKIVTEAEIQYSGQKPSQSRQFIVPSGTIPKLVLIPCNMIDNENKNN